MTLKGRVTALPDPHAEPLQLFTLETFRLANLGRLKKMLSESSCQCSALFDVCCTIGEVADFIAWMTDI